MPVISWKFARASSVRDLLIERRVGPILKAIYADNFVEWFYRAHFGVRVWSDQLVQITHYCWPSKTKRRDHNNQQAQDQQSITHDGTFPKLPRAIIETLRSPDSHVGIAPVSSRRSVLVPTSYVADELGPFVIAILLIVGRFFDSQDMSKQSGIAASDCVSGQGHCPPEQGDCSDKTEWLFRPHSGHQTKTKGCRLRARSGRCSSA